MRRILAFLIIVLAQATLCVEGRAQTPAPSSCPSVSIKYPTLWEPGQPVTISAEVDSSDAYLTANLKYNWSVSAGEIVSGQGTPTITVDTTALGGQNVTATVEIDGLPAGCNRTESCTLPPIEYMPSTRLFDKYGDISEHDEQVALDNFAVALKSEPGATGYVFLFGAGKPADSKARLKRIRKYLVSEGGIEPSSIETVDGGGGKFTIELYVRPTGAPLPKPEPRF